MISRNQISVATKSTTSMNQQETNIVHYNQWGPSIKNQTACIVPSISTTDQSNIMTAVPIKSPNGICIMKN